MTYLVILLVMLVAFTAVGWPLVTNASGGRRESRGVLPLEQLIGRRDAAYRGIKELEFEYELGNLSESDYRRLRERYRSEAAATLRELDAAVGGEGADEASPSGPASQAAVASAVSPRAEMSCPSCGRPTEAGDRYCSMCGARLEAVRDSDG